MAGTPKQSGIYAGSMTVRGNNLQNSLGNVGISGLFNSTSDPSGVLAVDAQINDYMNSLPGADPNAYDSDGAVAPTTDSTGSDRKLTSEEQRDIFSDNLTAGDIYGDTLAGYEGVRDAVTSAVIAAMQNDYLNSILESQLTPEEEEAQLLGLTVAQMNAKTEDMLDSILKSQGENETGFVNESARIAAEGILKGKIAQAGVTDPAAQEAALKSAMESLEGGASGLEAVKAAAGGAQDYVEELLKTAKDIIDKGYDATIGKLPEILTPESILIDPTTGQTTGTFEIGKTGGAIPGATSPIFGGTVGTVGGGTNVGIMTTGNAVLDAIIKGAKDGVDGQDIEDIVAVIIASNTGIPTDVIDAGISGAKGAIKAAGTVVASKVTDEDDDDTTNIAIGSGAVTTRTCEDGSLVGVNEACPEDTTVTTKTCDDGSVVDITEACPEDTTVTTRTCNSGSVVGINEACPEDLDDPCDNPKYAALNPVECGGVTDREIIDDDLVAKTIVEEKDCTDPEYAAANPIECAVTIVEEKDCTDPEYAAANPIECAVTIVEEKDCTDPEYAAANPIECAVTIVEEKDCTDPEYAAANPIECAVTIVEEKDCTDPEYAAANPIECAVTIVEEKDCTDPEYAAANPIECAVTIVEEKDCTDPEYAAANPIECAVTIVEEKDCTDPEYAAANPIECAVTIVEEKDCTDPEYAAANPIECAVVEEKDCTDPEYAAANPIECAVTIVEEKDCTDPEYAAANPAKCGTVNLCDDPVYAAQNPAKCGIVGGDPCDDPEYAASRPGECGTIGGDPCDDPAYAAANPAECGIVLPPGGTTTSTLPTMQGYRAVQTKPGEKVGALDFYNISGPSIFRSGAKTEEEEDPLGYLYSNYSEGGIVQDYDIEELIRFLENQRG
jgi:hypothetical protein